MEKQNKNFLFWGLIILIVCALLVVLILHVYKLKNAGQIESGEQQIVSSEDANVFKVNIDPKDCLSKDQIKEILDLGEFSDNEIMVYKNDNRENPIEVWKIKVKEEQDAKLVMRRLTVRRDMFIEEFEDMQEMKELLEKNEGNTLNCVKNVVTLIVSNHLEEVQQETNNWLRE